jgi:threonine dehydratase
VVTVSEDELREALVAALTRAHRLVEGAGAAALAAARSCARQGRRGRVVCVVSGGNVDVRMLSGLVGVAGASRFEA